MGDEKAYLILPMLTKMGAVAILKIVTGEDYEERRMSPQIDNEPATSESESPRGGRNG